MKKLHIYIVVCVIAGILLCTPFDAVYAAGGDSDMAQTLGNVAHLIIGMLSWLWVLLAALAGKLLTNDLVYGEFINLDQSLFKLRNISKNFANFLLGFLFLWTILKYFIDKEESAGQLVKSIVGFIVGGIAIQMSWFLVGAIIDVSTIMTVSLGAFPSLVINQDQQLQATLQNQKVRLPKKVLLNFQNTGDQPFQEVFYEQANTYATADEAQIQEEEVTLEEFLDTISPTSESLAGPMIYIGTSVFHVQDYLTMTNNTGFTDWSDLIATIFLKAGVLILFSFFMLLLVVASVIRVVYLWLFIAISPFMFLLYFLETLQGTGSSLNEGLKGNEKLGDIGFMSFLSLVFMPVLYIAYIGIGMIMLITMQKILVNNENGGIFVNDSTQITNDSIQVLDSSITILGNIRPNWQNDTATTITDMLLMVVGLIILGGLVYLASSTRPDFVKNTVQSVRTFGSEIAKATPVFGKMNYNSLTSGSDGLISKVKRKFEDEEGNRKAAIQDKTDELFNLKTTLGNKSYVDLQKYAQKDVINDSKGGSSMFLNKARDAVSNLSEEDATRIPGGYLSLTNDRQLGSSFTNWFANNGQKIVKFYNNEHLNHKINVTPESGQSFEDFVKSISEKKSKTQFLKRLHTSMGGSSGDSIDNQHSYRDFLKAKLK